MAFNPQVRETKGDYDVMPEGLYPARVARIIELGDQETKYGVKTQVVMGFGFPTETVEVNDEQMQRMMWTFPMTQTSNPDSKLMKYIKAIKADCTHLNQLIIEPCMVEVVHTKKEDKVYANISSVTKPLAGLDIPDLSMDTFMYEFENGEDEIFNQLGEFRQEQIRKAVNFGQ